MEILEMQYNVFEKENFFYYLDFYRLKSHTQKILTNE